MQPDAQNRNVSGRTGGESRTEKPALKIVIIFETVRSGERARLKIQRLLSEMHVAPEVETGLWGFEEVGQPELCEQAGAQAQDADIILLSADGAGLPAPIVELLERWLPEKSTRPAALVALFGEDKPVSGQLPGAEEYLRRKAEAAGLDFFCETAPDRDHGWDSCSRSILDRPAGGSQIAWVDTPEALAHQGYGIND